MPGWGKLHRAPSGVVPRLMQLQLPGVPTPTDPPAQTRSMVTMVADARHRSLGMHPGVFHEYALHGRSREYESEPAADADQRRGRYA